MELLLDPQAWIAFATLTALELVLGIDNIVFISVLVDRLPPERREFARRLGLGLAMFMRIALLLLLAWMIGLTAPERCSDLIDDLQRLLKETPPAAVLFVSGRDKSETQTSKSYAFNL